MTAAEQSDSRNVGSVPRKIALPREQRRQYARRGEGFEYVRRSQCKKLIAWMSAGLYRDRVRADTLRGLHVAHGIADDDDATVRWGVAETSGAAGGAAANQLYAILRVVSESPESEVVVESASFKLEPRAPFDVSRSDPQGDGFVVDQGVEQRCDSGQDPEIVCRLELGPQEADVGVDEDRHQSVIHRMACRGEPLSKQGPIRHPTKVVIVEHVGGTDDLTEGSGDRSSTGTAAEKQRAVDVEE